VNFVPVLNEMSVLGSNEHELYLTYFQQKRHKSLCRSDSFASLQEVKKDCPPSVVGYRYQIRGRRNLLNLRASWFIVRVGSSMPSERVCPLLIVKRLFATKEKRVVPARQELSPAFWTIVLASKRCVASGGPLGELDAQDL
jgi:hypothetical protein